MGPLIVVVQKVLAEHPPEVALRGDQHPIQAFPTAAADPPLRVGVGPGRQ
jgi:hypothetical protein